MKKKLVKVLALIFILLLFLGSVYNIAIAEVQDVVLSIYPRPKIDVILAKSRTKTDVSNFKDKLTAELTKERVDTSDIEIQEIQAQTITDVSSFDWVRKESSSVGKITIQEGGKDVEFVGNQTNAGKNVMYIMPTENQEQKFKFDYSIDFGDSFKAAGMLLRVKEDGSNLTRLYVKF